MSSCFVFVQLLMWGGVVDHLDFIGVDLVYFCKTPGFIGADLVYFCKTPGFITFVCFAED